MVKFGWDKLKRFLAQANTWTGQQTFSNIAVTGGTIGGATITENLTTSTDPAANAAVTTAIVNSYNGVVVTLTAAGNTQTIQNPTTAATIRKFMVVNNDTSNNNLSVVANSVTFVLTPGEGQCFIWDGTAWGPTDLGITSLPVPVTQGGTGLATITDHGVMVGSGTGAVTPLSVGTNGQVLVGSTGADPVFATITDGEGIDTTGGAGTLTIACEDASTTNKGVVELATVAEAVAGTSTTLTPTCDGVAAAVAVVEREPNQGVAMTYAASGSTGIQVADNDNIDFGTGNFTIVWMGSLPDWTPSANTEIFGKWLGDVGWSLEVLANTGHLGLYLNAGPTYKYSTPAPTVVDGTKHTIVAVIVRETASSDGYIQYYVDGLQLGSNVVLAQGVPSTYSNAATLYVSGRALKHIASTTHCAYTFNRALSATEVLDLYRNGIAYADKWGSQTPIYTSNFSAGVDSWSGYSADVQVTGNTDSIDGEDDWLKVERINSVGSDYINRATGFTAYKHNSISFKVYNNAGSGFTHFAGYKGGGSRVSGVVAVAEGASGTLAMSHVNTSELASSTTIYISPCDVSGNMITNAAVGSLWYIKNINTYNSGATLALEPEGIQPAPGQWLDSSSNKLHAMQPATGSSLTRYKKDFEYRWTNTWTASSAAQYVGGLNQAVLSADHFITDIITQATVTTDVENLTLGDGSDADRFVTAFAPSATRTKQTVAAQNDGTNLKLVYTPAAEATMTVETIIRGFIWEP